MKIQGTNITKITSAYSNQLKAHKQPNKHENPTDKLKISSEAMTLQQNEKTSTKRSEYVKELKKVVQSGKYEVNHNVTAEKMIDFWSKHS